jgi:hypothetical protein
MITVNIDKAKVIGHNIRREQRAEEFKPFDEAIAKQIPGQVDGAESARQAIREKYVAIQSQVDSATTAEQIKQALSLE